MAGRVPRSSLSLELVAKKPDLVSGPSVSSSPRLEYDSPSEVLPFLYLGSMADAENAKKLRSLKIRYILTVSTDCPSSSACCSSPNTGDQSQTGEFLSLQIPVLDDFAADLASHFDAAFEFIETARMSHCKILIHCQAGISRSATVTIAYLMKYRNMGFEEALAFVKKARSIVAPNINFTLQLMELEKKLKGGSNQSEKEATL